MPHKSKLAPEVKVVLVEDYLSGRKGYCATLRDYGISDYNLRVWVQLYKNRGSSGLYPSSTRRMYSKEVKLAAIKDHLENKLSLLSICEKYDITKHNIVQRWIVKYNSHEDFKQPNSGGAIYMAKGRDTTLEERVEIVSHCIANNKDYGKTTEQYSVSYQQVYGWIKKYESGGIDALIDRRGKRKDEFSMTEVEKLQAQLKLQKAENLRLQMENDLLKKLETLERGIDID